MKWSKTEPDDDVYTLVGWYASQCILSPEDGTGCWAKYDYGTNSYAYQWELDAHTFPRPEWATHVVWFNK